MPGDGAGDGIQPLFQAGDAGIQPVAIAVERIDGGGEPPRLALGFPGEKLDLLRLPGQVDGGDLFALEAERRLVGHHGHDDRGGSASAPGRDPPQRTAIERILVGQQLAQHASRVFRLEIREMVWFLGQAPLALLKAHRITPQTVTGKIAVYLNWADCGQRIGWISGGKQSKRAQGRFPATFRLERGLVPPINLCLPRCDEIPGTRMTARSSLTVVLAAGEGTRMRSSLPKVLHPIAGQPLLAHVLDAAPHGPGAALAVVIGPDHKAVADEVKRVRPDASTFVQAERLGTAHAVLAAREAIARGADDLLVAFGDTPLISAETFARLRAPLEKGAALAVLGFRAADPTGYGRLLLEGDRLMAIREHADATERRTQGDAVQRRRDGVRRPAAHWTSSTASATPTARANIIWSMR